MNTVTSCDAALLPNTTSGMPPNTFNLISSDPTTDSARFCQGESKSFECTNPGTDLIKEFYPAVTTMGINCGLGGQWEDPAQWPMCVSNYTCEHIIDTLIGSLSNRCNT